MDMRFLTRGLAIGLSIAAPVGPIGLLCIRLALKDGFRAGLAAGLGAATADAAYGAVAGLGLTSISGPLMRHQTALGTAGGACLCLIGLRTFLSRPATEEARGSGRTLASTYATTLLLTLANPATILSFAAVFAALGLGSSPGLAHAAALVLGVFLGSACWWVFLCGGVSAAHARLGPGWMRAVNRISGAALLAFGAYALFRP